MSGASLSVALSSALYQVADPYQAAGLYQMAGVYHVAQAAGTAGQSTADTEQLGAIAGFAVQVMDALGGIGIALLVALENLFPPIPSELVLPMAGFTASQGDSFTLFGAIGWATVGAVLGALVLYGLARLFGRERTRWFLGKMPLFDESTVDRTEEFFEKYKQPAVFFGRMVPGIRSLISLPAGAVSMPLSAFIILTTVGSALWNVLLIVSGYILGENWHIVEQHVGVFSKVVLILAIFAVVLFIAVRLRTIMRNRKQGK